MKKEIKDLIEVSNHFGRNKDYVIAGGGNTSYKDGKHLWVKGSGTCLEDITSEGFVQLNRERLDVIARRNYSNDTIEREHQVKLDLNNAAIFPERNIRPSVETSLHNIIEYRFVVHTHPTVVNALICSKNAEKTVKEMFGSKALFIPFIDPGYRLFINVMKALEEYKKKNRTHPQIIFLQNHGMIVSADNIGEIKDIYKDIEKKVLSKIKVRQEIKPLKLNESTDKILPAIRMLTFEGKSNIVKIRHNTLIKHFYKDREIFRLVSHPFIPDMVVYCKADFIYIDKTGKPEEIIDSLKIQVSSFNLKFGYMPKIIMIKNYGLLSVDSTSRSAEIILDIYENLLKVSYYAMNFGGPRFLSEAQIDFIDNWEVENYRRSRTVNIRTSGKVNNKIFIVTGGAQGFGKGIAERLFAEGANIVIADVKEDEGNELVKNLDSGRASNYLCFHKTDVSDARSVEELIKYTVCEFGGLDAIISNAGILHAGSLEEMSPETFDMMTKVNYTGYFHCVKYASQVMKAQWQYNRKWFMDIIQINSKSGLKGSNKNFAYAGGKFGGIGLTQSFALELMPFNIKVNSICPGNFFDGPLWYDPKTGLFVQYLKTGKVPGAKTIADVRRFYESQVPANRGCRVEDVMKAIYYVIEQEYETGQAVPVTGGQNMVK